ncbi:hypothetical protein QYE76_029124 [Lolium multiflorum]|uniref:Retrotransposon gag domain-containing protein n=1 Tax=Lolium multiflorum TaxID=4521 RepID=A0AAD8VHK0_LOLMU|nr:hypothetical protein QYE76_029124 [Lolium multiflorum]
MADGTPVTYEDLTDELKKKYDEIKVILEADLIGSFHRTRSHGIRWKGFSPNGDGIDLCPSEERTRSLREEINYLVAHSLHRHSENLVNTLERVALRVIQEIMRHQYSPSGPALGTHQGELPLQSRPPLPYALAAPEVPATPAFVVYKIGGDPSDYQFLPEAPKEVPHGYTCTYVRVATGHSQTRPQHQGLLGKQEDVSDELEKQTWLTKYATPMNLRAQLLQLARAGKANMVAKRAIGYSKPYPDDYEMIPLPPKYRLPDFSKFSGSDGSSSIEHVGRYLAQLGPASVSDQLRVRLFSQSLTGSAFGWYTSLPPDSIRTWKQLEEQFHMQYHSEASESGIADLAQLRQKRGETVTEYIQRFRILGTDVIRLSLMAHMVRNYRHMNSATRTCSKTSSACVVLVVQEDEVPAGDQEVAVAEWTRGGTPVSCKWVKPPGPPRGFDFDVTKTEQIFDLLLKEKQLTIPEGLKFPTVQELNGKPYANGTTRSPMPPTTAGMTNADDPAMMMRDRLAREARRHRRHNRDEEEHERRATEKSREQDDNDRHWDCPFFRHCWDSGMSRLPTIGNCPECNRKKKEAANVSVFKRLGPLPPQSKRAESPRWADLEDSKTRDKKRKKTGTTVQGGALMDSAVHKSAGFSDCAAWRKPKGYTCIR